MGKMTEKTTASVLAAEDQVILNAGNEMARMTVEDFRQHLNDNDVQVLNDLAFYIDVNEPSASGELRVDVGGNLGMRELWEDAKIPVLMDKHGNCARLNRDDSRYFEDGTKIVEVASDGTTTWGVSWAQQCDFMIVIPKYYGRVQSVMVDGNVRLRCWFSLVPLPGGYEIPQQVVGMFKLYSAVRNANAEGRSVPGVSPTVSDGSTWGTVRDFWLSAQKRSRNHGIANLGFRNFLMIHMMSKYGWRSSQACKNGEGTTIWGDGLSGMSDSSAITGRTLSLGVNDGKAVAADSSGHEMTGRYSVNVAGFENPWGQFGEVVQGLYADGVQVYHWDANAVPEDPGMAGLDYTMLGRPVAAQTITVGGSTVPAQGMNVVADRKGQGLYMIYGEAANGAVNYGDTYTYGASGNTFVFGGAFGESSGAGLERINTSAGWDAYNAMTGSRLAYYGDVFFMSKDALQNVVNS